LYYFSFDLHTVKLTAVRSFNFAQKAAMEEQANNEMPPPEDSMGEDEDDELSDVEIVELEEGWNEEEEHVDAAVSVQLDGDNGRYFYFSTASHNEVVL